MTMFYYSKATPAPEVKTNHTLTGSTMAFYRPSGALNYGF